VMIPPVVRQLDCRSAPRLAQGRRLEAAALGRRSSCRAVLLSWVGGIFRARLPEVRLESRPKNLVGRRIGDRLLRSGTSAGVNYAEARGAESKEDFVRKFQIALKELRESKYWLRLIAGIVPRERSCNLLEERNQLRAMVSKAVATAKGKAK
jgi:four helix bundle protein